MAKSVFNNFNDKAIRVILLAQEEARQLGHNRCGSEQILLGLIAQEGTEASSLLKETGLSLSTAREIVRNMIGVKKDFESSPWFLRWLQVFQEMPFSKSTQEILKLAAEEAHQLNHAKIAPEHLLLGLLRLHTGSAIQVLQDAHISKEKLRQALLPPKTDWQS